MCFRVVARWLNLASTALGHRVSGLNFKKRSRSPSKVEGMIFRHGSTLNLVKGIIFKINEKIVKITSFQIC